MQRFKRKSLVISENNADSDENKIRRQLLLDLDYFKTLGGSYNIETTHLEALMLRANPSVEVNEILNPIQSIPTTVGTADEACVSNVKH